LQAIQATSVQPNSATQIIDSSKFFDTFETFKTWAETDREVIDVVYLVEWRNSNPPNLSHPDIRIASNGMTVDSMPDFVRTITSALSALSKPGSTPTVGFEYSVLPSDRVFRTIDEDAIEIALFSTVVFIPTILTAATNYGTEAETGLRDLFLAYGLSPSANRVRWWLVCFIVSLSLTIPYVIGISAVQEISFFLLLLTFFLAAGSIVSFTFALIALRLTQSMGRVVVFFWAIFSWMYTEDGFDEKRILTAA
jgi:hypothetical protein